MAAARPAQSLRTQVVARCPTWVSTRIVAAVGHDHRMEAVGLPPEEEETFAKIVSELRGLGREGIPWRFVAACVVVVAFGVGLAALLGAPLLLVVASSVAFILALAGGLAVIALLDRNRRAR
jgi:hypothetical protein